MLLDIYVKLRFIINEENDAEFRSASYNNQIISSIFEHIASKLEFNYQHKNHIQLLFYQSLSKENICHVKVCKKDKIFLHHKALSWPTFPIYRETQLSEFNEVACPN